MEKFRSAPFIIRLAPMCDLCKRDHIAAQSKRND